MLRTWPALAPCTFTAWSNGLSSSLAVSAGPIFFEKVESPFAKPARSTLIRLVDLEAVFLQERCKRRERRRSPTALSPCRQNCRLPRQGAYLPQRLAALKSPAPSEAEKTEMSEDF
jgi:hypothetical protein